MLSWLSGGGASKPSTPLPSGPPDASLERVRASYDKLVLEALFRVVEVVLCARLTPAGLAEADIRDSGYKVRVRRRVCVCVPCARGGWGNVPCARACASAVSRARRS